MDDIASMLTYSHLSSLLLHRPRLSRYAFTVMMLIVAASQIDRAAKPQFQRSKNANASFWLQNPSLL